MILWLSLLLFLWLAFNVVSSYAPLLLSQRISPGRLPKELLQRGEARRMRFYVGPTIISYAFSSWAPPLWHVVVFNETFFQKATPSLLRFVIAHELGHAASRHHVLRWWSVVTGLILLPQVRRALERQEEQADAYAERLTGLKRDFFKNHFTKQGIDAHPVAK